MSLTFCGGHFHLIDHMTHYFQRDCDYLWYFQTYIKDNATFSSFPDDFQKAIDIAYSLLKAPLAI